MNSKEIKDKAFFVVALLAAFLAFSSFKDSLSSIYLSIANHNYNLLHIVIFFVGLLTISVYFYALDYIKYSFGKYQNFLLFRMINPIANFFYAIAILFPVFILFVWIVGSSPTYDFLKANTHTMEIFDSFGAVLLVLTGFFSAYFRDKMQNDDLARKLEKVQNTYIQTALKFYDKEFYGGTVLEVFNALEQFLRENLLKIGRYTESVSIDRLLELAQKNNIINGKDAKDIRDLRIQRNQYVHRTGQISKQNAEAAISLMKKFLENKPVNK